MVRSQARARGKRSVIFGDMPLTRDGAALFPKTMAAEHAAARLAAWSMVAPTANANSSPAVDASPAPFVVTGASTPFGAISRERSAQVGPSDARVGPDSSKRAAPAVRMKSPCSPAEIAAMATPHRRSRSASSSTRSIEKGESMRNAEVRSSRLGLTRSVWAAIVRSTAFQSAAPASDVGSTTARSTEVIAPIALARFRRSWSGAPSCRSRAGRSGGYPR